MTCSLLLLRCLFIRVNITAKRRKSIGTKSERQNARNGPKYGYIINKAHVILLLQRQDARSKVKRYMCRIWLKVLVKAQFTDHLLKPNLSFLPSCRYVLLLCPFMVHMHVPLRCATGPNQPAKPKELFKICNFLFHSQKSDHLRLA